MTKLFYGNTTHPEAKGRKFINARYFDGAVEGATDVIVDGDHPEIVAAYKAAKVPVRAADPAAYAKQSERDPVVEPAVQVPQPKA